MNLGVLAKPKTFYGSKDMFMDIDGSDKNYGSFLSQLKETIRTTQFKAALSLNRELVQLYWKIGKKIIKSQANIPWGDGFLDKLSKDLTHTFQEMRGFSKTNLKYMRILAQLYPTGFGQHPVDELPWGHVTLLIRIKEAEVRHWYLRECVKQGWSRPNLEREIKSSLFERQAVSDNKVSNYLEKHQSPHTLLAQEIIKSPYNFDFLECHDEALEREIEHGLIKHITKFLLELGKGFSFVGQQYRVELGENEYFIDILLYHTKLHCYVVVELKSGEFDPGHVGKLNFYINIIDEKLKTPEDKPSIGLLLCKSKDNIIAEYSLKGFTSPIGISEYMLTNSIPENFKINLPTIQEIEKELSKDIEE